MKRGAHVGAALQILENFESEGRPLDKVCSYFFKQNRFIGSKDRRAISELVYGFMRQKNLLECWAKKIGLNRSTRSCMMVYLNGEDLGEIFKDETYCPEPLTKNEKKALPLLPKNLEDESLSPYILLNYPRWMEASLQASFPDNFEAEMRAFLETAPFDLRSNPLKTTRDDLHQNLSLESYELTPTELSPLGLRSNKRLPLDQTNAFKQGEVEVQDEGSQLICLLSQVKPNHQVLDFCAGAGGKTILLSALMNNKGQLLATDVHDRRLQECKKRLKRSGCQNAHTKAIEDENDRYLDRYINKMDRVLVDAPCTGSGTWRRNPDLKWRTTKADLDEICHKQQSILSAAARLVKSGGRLIYATCSVLVEENERQIEKFLNQHSDFTVTSIADVWSEELGVKCPVKGDYLRLSPHKHKTDGFFAAILTKNS